MKRLEDLPRDAQRNVLNLPPELRQLAIDLFPSEAADRERRAAFEAEQRKKLEARRSDRERRVKQALEGAFGRQAQLVAEAALSETGGDYTPTAVQRVIDMLRQSGVRG